MLWFALRSAVIFALAGILTLLLRRKSASLRHLVWLAAFVAVIAMPTFTGIAPIAQVQAPPAIRAFTPRVRGFTSHRVQDSDSSPIPSQMGEVMPAAATIETPSGMDSTEPPRVDPYSAVAALYWLGLVGFGVRYGLSFRSLRRAVRHSQRLETNGISIRLVEAGYLASPATFGWPRATILLPAESETWPEDRRQAALDHEEAHIERADWIWQCLALGVCAVQWFNPLAWLATSRLRAEAEGAADDAVLRKGLAASEYAQELLEVAKGVRQSTLLAVPIARPGGVAARVRAILDRNRDRRPATHPAHLAAGTGTLFAAAILGGVGLSAVASSSAVSQRNPFALPLAPDVSTSSPGMKTYLPDGEFGVDQVQMRPVKGAAKGWDSIGRPDWVEETAAPRTPDIPGRKVREFALVCPAVRNFAVKLPTGAEMIQIARQKTNAILSVSFPANAQVTSLKLGYPKSAGSFRRTITLRPVIGPNGKRLWPNLAWFAVPQTKDEVRYQFLDSTGTAVPVLGQFSRRGDQNSFVAVDAKKAKDIRKAEQRTLDPEWYEFAPLLLDPAPKIVTRANAPVKMVPLAGGGELGIVRIEAQTSGYPLQAWAVDGKAPRKGPDFHHRSYGGQLDKGLVGRQVSVWVRWPKLREVSPSLSWIVTPPIDGRGSSLARLDSADEQMTDEPGTSGTTWSANTRGNGHSSWHSKSGGTHEAEVMFAIPASQRHAVLQLDYAFEPWKLVVDELVGGPVLRSSVKLSESTSNGIPLVEVEFHPPIANERMDVALEVYDANGELLKLDSTSGPSTDNVTGKIDYRRKAMYAIRSPKQIARLRLKARPFHHVTLPPLPMHPR